MRCVLGVVLASVCGSAFAGNPWADEVVSYDAGMNAVSGYTNPMTALGSPERVTGEGLGFPGVVSPFNPAFGTDELVSIGVGGHLTLRFDSAIVDHALNPFGIDFILFGNAGFVEQDFPNGSVGEEPVVFGVGGEATVEVSRDGVEWRTAAVTRLDLMPTLGYLDAGPFDLAGMVESDFTKPVDPSIGISDLAGLSYAELIALYDGSGGGIGIDLAGTGWSAVSYVRLSNFSDEAFELDAVADVRAIPSPAGVLVLGVLAVRRRRA